MAGKQKTLPGDYIITGNLTVVGAIVSDQLSQQQAKILASSPTFAQLDQGYNASTGGTTVPTQPTLTAVGLYSSIWVSWDRQDNLTNLAYYELQVSSDGVTWYSLRNDGVDWKQNLNSVTQVSGEVYSHQNIPFSGTVDAPIAVTLYYQVRRVTTAGVRGPWSATGPGTSSPIPPGSIAAAAITGAKIALSTITGSLIAARTILNSNIALGQVDASLLNPQGMPSVLADCYLHWSLDDLDKNATGSPGITPDNTGNGHDGTISGGTPAVFSPGRAGNAITANGCHIDATVTLGGTQSWVGWAAVADAGGRSLFSLALDGADTNYGLQFATTGHLMFRVGTTNYDFSPVYTYDQSGAPHCYAVVVTPTGAALWVDGVQVGAYTATLAATATAKTWRVSGLATTGVNTWAGMIDEVRVYNRALTLAEIQYLYLNPAGPYQTMITSYLVASRAIIGHMVVQSTLTGDLFAQRTITGSLVALSTITGTLIAQSTITGPLIKASTIQTYHIQAHSITVDLWAATDILFTHSIASITQTTPAAGDTRSIITKSSVEVDFYDVAWEQAIYLDAITQTAFLTKMGTPTPWVAGGGSPSSTMTITWGGENPTASASDVVLGSMGPGNTILVNNADQVAQLGTESLVDFRLMSSRGGKVVHDIPPSLITPNDVMGHVFLLGNPQTVVNVSVSPAVAAVGGTFAGYTGGLPNVRGGIFSLSITGTPTTSASYIYLYLGPSDILAWGGGVPCGISGAPATTGPLAARGFSILPAGNSGQFSWAVVTDVNAAGIVQVVILQIGMLL